MQRLYLGRGQLWEHELPGLVKNSALNIIITSLHDCWDNVEDQTHLQLSSDITGNVGFTHFEILRTKQN